MRTWLSKIHAFVLFGAVCVVLSAMSVRAQPAVTELSGSPAGLAKAYLGAVQARDFDAAYAYLSSDDRKIRDKHTYVRAQQPLSGFALTLAKWFASEMKFWTIEEHSDGNRVRLDIGYRLPTGDEVAPQLLDWKPDKLNALTRTQQRAIFTALEEVKTTGKMTMIEGRQTVVLVHENHGWKVFENWRSRQRVMFQASQPGRGKLGVEFLRQDILVKHDEPFQVDFKISNQTRREMWIRVKHALTPAAMEKNVDMIACGSLVPFRLAPGEMREISSVYLFRSGIAAGHPVTITYHFAAPSAASVNRTVVNTR